MPRIGRLHIPGGCYHVIGRGLERRFIFDEVRDKREFLARFGSNLVRFNAQCLAWALMSNHYHFLIRVSDIPLGKLMAPLLGGYAGYYNRRYGRSGYVFQNRFTSILCDEQSYLLSLVRYIHLNPLRAGLVESLSALADYPWTGHAGMLSRHRQRWHRSEEMLARFGQSRRHAIRRYLEFLGAETSASCEINLAGGGLVRSHGGWEGIARLRKEHLQCIGDERILGDAAFVEGALRQDTLAIETRSKLLAQGWDLELLQARVCRYCAITPAQIMRKGRGDAISRAKALFCYLGTEKLGFSTRQVADRLQISQPAVTKWRMKGSCFSAIDIESLRD